MSETQASPAANEPSAGTETTPVGQHDAVEPPAAATEAPAAAEPETPTTVPNPTDPHEPTAIPQDTGNAAHFLHPEGTPNPDFPKTLYHPVHGPLVLQDAGEQSRLIDPRSWFPSPELADAARTQTEAMMVHAKNMQAKLAAHDATGRQIVRNSASADASVRSGTGEPL